MEAELAKPQGCFSGAPKQLTASALALSALFAPAVCPAEYTGGFVPEIKMEDFSEAQQQRIKAWRERPIGGWDGEVLFFWGLVGGKGVFISNY